jgi:thiamine biosynthesis lipoprotein
LLKWDIKIYSGHENNTIFLKEEGMKLGFGIGQGFIADKIKALLISKGVVAGIVNVSGDINTWENNLMERNGKSRTQ